MDCCMREDGRHELLMPAAAPAPVLPPSDMFAADEDADENGSVSGRGEVTRAGYLAHSLV